MKPPRKTEEDIRKEEIRKILGETNPYFKSMENDEINFEIESKEYKTFKEEEKSVKLSLYEKLCNFSEIDNLEPGKEMKEKMQNAINFAHLNITPKGAFSFAILTGVSLFLLSIIFMFFGLSFTNILIIIILAVVSVFFFVKYPELLADNVRIKASQEIILAIIYIVIFMRTSPQMEGAVRFAAKNLSGPLAYDLRKMLWDVETRKYETIYDAMENYLKNWEKNREFMEAIQLVNNSLEQPESKRHQMLDESINVILQGTEEKMKKYSQSLRTPIMIIFALGITLPILVLVLFPVLVLMLSESINPLYLVVIYDVLLPIMIFVISYEVLRRRPVGYSTVDTTLHAKYSPLGKLKLKLMGVEKIMPLWPLGVIISSPVIIIGIFVMFLDKSNISFLNLLGSIILIWGLGIGFASVFILESKMKIDIRNQIKKIQDEFGEALFQLGNRLALGNPLERAMEQTIEKSPDLTTSELFRKVLKNIKRSNLGLEAAIFDKNFGAIWEYPSKLVINIMKIVYEATKKGVKNAAISAISISRYIKQIHGIEESLNEMLSETTSSMRLLGMFIAPLIAGVTVTMTAVMMTIFFSLGQIVTTMELGSGNDMGMGGIGLNNMLMGGWGKVGEMVSIGVFQIVVGIYVIEICYLISFLVSGIDTGPGDIIGRRQLAGWTLLIGLLVYTFSVLMTYFTFAPMVNLLIFNPVR